MRAYEFSRRNFREVLRDPLSWCFMIALPVLLFVALKVMVAAVGQGIEATPQFRVDHMTVSMMVFSFSFLTIFVANILSRDREDKYLMRLKSTPMTAADFVIGFTLPMLPFVVLQSIAVLITGFCFGLPVSGKALLLVPVLLPVSLIFIGFGILFGSLLPSKGVGGVASVIPTAASLLGGMFFPLDIIEGGFHDFCYALPFANAIGIGQSVIGQTAADVPAALLNCGLYIVGVFGISVVTFGVKLHRDSI